jgi:ATP phosphoribosyltransferase
VLTRIAAEEEARTSREVRAAFDPGRVAELAAVVQELGATLPYGPPAGAELVLHCRASRVFEIVATLQALGAQEVTVRTFDYLFKASNPLTDRLLHRLG